MISIKWKDEVEDHEYSCSSTSSSATATTAIAFGTINCKVCWVYNKSNPLGLCGWDCGYKTWFGEIIAIVKSSKTINHCYFKSVNPYELSCLLEDWLRGRRIENIKITINDIRINPGYDDRYGSRINLSRYEIVESILSVIKNKEHYLTKEEFSIR